MARRGLLRRRRGPTGRWAAPFATDLLRACEDAFAALGPPRASVLRLPITVPFDDTGRVVLSSAPPQPDAPRVPAELEIVRQPSGFGLGLRRSDGRPWLVPGVAAAGDGTDQSPPLVRLTFDVAGDGMVIAGWTGTGDELPIELDESTARALATALLITVGIKLTKARYPQEQSREG